MYTYNYMRDDETAALEPGQQYDVYCWAQDLLFLLLLLLLVVVVILLMLLFIILLFLPLLRRLLLGAGLRGDDRSYHYYLCYLY